MAIAGPAPARRVALGVGAALAWAAVGALTPPSSLVLALVALSVVLVVVVFTFDGAGLRALLLPVRPRSIVVGVLGGGAMALVTHLGYAATAALWPAIRGEVRGLYAVLGATSLPTPVAVAAIALVVGAEELLWRGAVLGTAREPRALRPWRAALALSSVAYGLGDLPIGGPLLAATALGCGLVWGVVRVLGGELVTVIVVHLVWDLVVLGLVPLEARGLTSGR